MAHKHDVFLEYWRQQITRGHQHYLLAHGLHWGITMILLTQGLPNLLSSQPSTFDFTSVITAAFWLAGGFAAAQLSWQRNNKRYWQLLKQQRQPVIE